MKTLLILFLLPVQVFAQDITGVWTGFLQIGDSSLPYELTITGNDNKLSGYSMLVFTFNGVENVGIKTMQLKVKRASISIEDGELIYDNYTTESRKVKLYGNLVWVGRDTNMTLVGSFSTRSMDMRALNENSFKGTIRLQRKGPFAKTKLVSKLNEMNLLNEFSFQPLIKKKENERAPKNNGIKEQGKISRQKSRETVSSNPNKETVPVSEPDKKQKQPEKIAGIIPAAAELAERKTEIIQTVPFQSDSLRISLYDNGEVDGDTVSVILNNKVIISKQGLTTKAATTIIYTSDIGDSLELIMYAENLGRIPPNTGLLILQDGKDRYQIRFSGDLQKNSAIILKRKH
jgi:hypothetical protein